MTDFLFALGKVNLALAAAIILVSLLRRPLRAQFGAPIAYAIWFLVPIAAIASLLPPRMAPPLAPIAPVYLPAAPAFAIGHIAHSTLGVTDQLTGQGALILSVPPATSAIAMPQPALLLFAAWSLGALLMTLYLTRLQVRFHAAARLGKAGPAVLGFITPRIVTPAGFPEQFTAQEQAAILAHEHVHLARQDARINALAALLRCLCWFNPLIHLGARWLRVDQELACDATAVAAGISRRDYAKALLKSQLVVTSLPLGCNWPGAQHPLIERIALLKRKPPGAVRRLAGVSLVLLAATLAGLSAWAAQPPVAAKAVAARPHMVLAALPAAAPDQTAQEPVANANPAGGDNDADVSNSVSASKVTPATPAPVRVEAPREASIAALTGTILAAPPQIASGIASLNAANQPTARTSPDASPKPSDTSTGPPLTAFASGAPSVAAATPRSETELALECYLGFGATRCKKNDCDPVGRVDYLGTNAAGADLYEVQFMHHNRAYVVAPNPDGKIGHYLIKSADPYWIKQTVSSRAAQGLIYTRPENSPVVSACPTSGPHIDEYG